MTSVFEATPMSWKVALARHDWRHASDAMACRCHQLAQVTPKWIHQVLT